MAIKRTIIKFGNPNGGIRYIFEWAKQLWNPSNEVNIDLDFSNLTFVRPFDAIFIINQISQYKIYFPSSIIKIYGLEDNYFSEKIGLSSILQPENFTAAMGDEDNMLAIRKITLSEFRGVGVSPQVSHEAIENQSGVLAKHLTMSETGSIYDTVQFSLREVIRNIFEHSCSENLMYAATYHPTSKIAEICVSDTGQGIHSALTFNKKFSHLNPKQALEWACLPGVSGNPSVHEYEGSSSPWKNSGYGLYMMNRLCRNQGDFLLISNKTALYMQRNKNVFIIPENIGTTVRLHLNLGMVSELKTELARYAEEGREISKGIKGASIIQASMASTMLRRDFNI